MNGAPGMRIDNMGRGCLYVTREPGVEAGGAHPSKSAKGEAAGFGVVQRWASPLDYFYKA